MSHVLPRCRSEWPHPSPKVHVPDKPWMPLQQTHPGAGTQARLGGCTEAPPIEPSKSTCVVHRCNQFSLWPFKIVDRQGKSTGVCKKHEVSK